MGHYSSMWPIYHSIKLHHMFFPCKHVRIEAHSGSGCLRVASPGSSPWQQARMGDDDVKIKGWNRGSSAFLVRFKRFERFKLITKVGG